MSDFTGFGMQDQFRAIVAERERKSQARVGAASGRNSARPMPNSSVALRMNGHWTPSTSSHSRL